MKIRSQAHSLQRSPLVDAVRGISILAVMLFHFDMYYHLKTCLLVKALHLSHVVTLITRNGYFGVTMFFVISGFLITSTSLQRYGRLRAMNPVSFYWFRFARIAPCLVLVLIVLVALHYSGNPYFKLNTRDYSVLSAVIHVLTFRFNALLVHFGWNINQWNVLWSLSIEEAFYICFPLVCILIRDARLFAGLCIIIFSAGPFARFHATPMGQIYGYFSCFDQLALGCLTAICFPLIRPWFENSRFAISVPILGAFMAACGYLWGEWQKNIVFGPTFIALGTALLLIGSACTLPPILRFLQGGIPPLSWLGQRSYEIYLFHLIVIQFMWIVSADLKLNLAVDSPLWLLLFFFVAYAVAYLIFRFWSEPMNHWIRSIQQRFVFPQAATGSISVKTETQSKAQQSVGSQR
jgi:peptidoglycan/LPS O-acetylase OafA/YrhL